MKRINELYETALEARNRAWAPVTGITFGAALKTKAGDIFVGANIEEWSLVLTRHAEMVAIDNMIFMKSGDEIIDMLVVVGDPQSLNMSRPVYPCGVCRNYISQFADEDTVIVASNLDGSIYRNSKLHKLLTHRPFKQMKEIQ
jgi:cytidine deaminase